MSNLHAFLALRNEQSFAKALESAKSSTSRSKSSAIDVNARDAFGRTVLHIACANAQPYALAYVRLLLAHPSINVNIQDTESRWTPLHRALYSGNVAAAIMLMQRTDTDTQLRDYGGYTPFDLYNSTVDGTAPAAQDIGATDLFTWGVNRNAALGHGDTKDLTVPVPVVIPVSINTNTPPFTPIRIRDICMDKLHTAVITDEPRGNLRVCGRIGASPHAQHGLLPVPQLTAHITAVALGQDHTLALTSTGEVLSWGLNRFAQLGYPVERGEEQGVPRRVLGPLKKERVTGVAACRSASACWTREEVYTWGVNGGQLGYDSAAQPIQVLPRKVTGVKCVKEIALTDSAMACLLETKDVVCFRGDIHFRIKFPTHDSSLSLQIFTYFSKPAIVKITSDQDNAFAALSEKGDVFTFAAPALSFSSSHAISVSPSSFDVEKDEIHLRNRITPQRVWGNRRSFDPAVDIALGTPSTLLISTRSGHVFLRSANGKPQRVRGLQGVVAVCANAVGGFGVLGGAREAGDMNVVRDGTGIAGDLGGVRPWMGVERREEEGLGQDVRQGEDAREGEVSHDGLDENGRDHDHDIDSDDEQTVLATVTQFCASLEGGTVPTMQHGSDTIFRVKHSGRYISIPAHRAILVARSDVLLGMFHSRGGTVTDGGVKVTVTVRATLPDATRNSGAQGHAANTGITTTSRSTFPVISISGCHALTVFLLLEFIYTDRNPMNALWDKRITLIMARAHAMPGVMKTQLETLSRLLGVDVSNPTLTQDIKRLFHHTLSPPDVILELADREIACHSVILRARSLFFRAFFEEEVWTAGRWHNGVVRVDLGHMEWRAWRVVVKWLFHCEVAVDSLFEEEAQSVESVEELVDVVFDVMAVASELLFDQLMFICSAAILRRVALHSAAPLLTNASYYNALELVDSIHAYMTCNMEALLERHLLDDTQPDIIRALGIFVRQKQAEKSPATRMGVELEALVKKHKEWLEMQDIPTPVVRSGWAQASRESSKNTPVSGGKNKGKEVMVRRPPHMTPLASPVIGTGTEGDDIFAMEDEGIPVLSLGQPQSPGKGYTLPSPAWKSKSVKPVRVDMKSILAEAETETGKGGAQSRVIVGFDMEQAVGSSNTPKWSQKPSQRERRKQLGQTQTQGEPSVDAVVSRVSTSKSPWNVSPSPSTVNQVAAYTTATQRTPQTPAASRVSIAQTPSPVAISKRQPASPASNLQQPGGSPASLSSPTFVPRRKSSDSPAWTNKTPVHDNALSFADIQQQQRDQEQQPKGKRSLREIQEEERAQQEEEEFLRWWAAEEERLKAEQAAQAASVNASADASGNRGRNGRRGSRGRRRVAPGRGTADISTGQ